VDQFLDHYSGLSIAALSLAAVSYLKPPAWFWIIRYRSKGWHWE
jgi:hypothetical protein